MKKQTILLLKFRVDGLPMLKRSSKIFAAYGNIDNNKKLNMKEGMQNAN